MQYILIVIFLVSIILTGCKQKEDVPFSIECELLTDNLIQDGINPDFDQGHYKTYVWSSRYPPAPFTVRLYRPLVAEHINQVFHEWTVTKEEIARLEEKLDRPLLLRISSKGFLPGEEAAIVVTDKEEKKILEKNSIPLPLFRTSKKDRAEISLKLLQTSPALYAVSLQNFSEKKVRMTSTSESFSSSQEILTNSEPQDNFSPNIDNVEGGIAKIDIERENGEVIKLQVPWGNCLLPYYNGLIQAPNRLPIKS